MTLDNLKAITFADIYPWPNNLTPACRGASDPDVFFPFEEEDLEAAQEYCSHCDIRRLCRVIAARRGEEGVWGGELLANGKPTKLPKILRMEKDLAKKKALEEKKRELAKAC